MKLDLTVSSLPSARSSSAVLPPPSPGSRTWPPPSAIMSGVMPRSSPTFTDAPRSTSSRTMASERMWAAPCRAVRPTWFMASTSAPSARTSWTASSDPSAVTRVSAGTCPSPAATISGVVSSSVAARVSAPAAARRRITSMLASIAASRNGVAPTRLTRKRALAKPNWGGARRKRTSGSAPWASNASTRASRPPRRPLSDRHSASPSVSMPRRRPVSSVCQDPAAQCRAV